MKGLPFQIDRMSPVKFPFQVADGLRAGILNGFWRTGERLPTVREMHALLGVSTRAPLEALQILSREGLIALREKTGAVVCERKKSFKNGRVLLVVPFGAESLYIARMSDQIRMTLNERGYLVTSVSVLNDDGMRFDCRQLEEDLRQYFELVVVVTNQPEVTRVVAASELPYVIVDEGFRALPRGIRRPVTRFSEAESSAADDFVRHVVAAGLKRVTVVAKGNWDGEAFVRALESASVTVSRWNVEARDGKGRSENLRKAAQRVVAEKLFAGRLRRLPQLLLFTDDYVFSGAYATLLAHGCRIPGDVCVVTVANRGDLPAYDGGSLTRVEHDVWSRGVRYGEAIADYLFDRRKKGPIQSSERYIVGDSFAAC